MKVRIHHCCACFADDNLLIGTREGRLLMYNVPSKTKSDENHKLELLRYSKSFNKKRIIQIDVVPDYNLLILLTGKIFDTYILKKVYFCLENASWRYIIMNGTCWILIGLSVKVKFQKVMFYTQKESSKFGFVPKVLQKLLCLYMGNTRQKHFFEFLNSLKVSTKFLQVLG